MIGRSRVPAPPERISPFRGSMRGCNPTERDRPCDPPSTSRTTTAPGISSGCCGACEGRPGRSTSCSSTTAPRTTRWRWCASEFPEVSVLELGRNLGFGPAINRAAREHPADPLILLNNDTECEPRFVEAMLDGRGRGRRDGGRRAAPGTRAGADRLRRRGRRPHPDGLRLPARRAAPGAGGARPIRSGRPAAPPSTGARPSRPSAASTSASSSTTRTSTWRCGCARPAAAAAWRPRRGRCTPTRPASAPAAATSTPAPAGAAATCCAATG